MHQWDKIPIKKEHAVKREYPGGTMWSSTLSNNPRHRKHLVYGLTYNCKTKTLTCSLIWPGILKPFSWLKLNYTEQHLLENSSHGNYILLFLLFQKKKSKCKDCKMEYGQKGPG